jgi:hypothetical protein
LSKSLKYTDAEHHRHSIFDYGVTDKLWSFFDLQ